MSAGYEIKLAQKREGFTLDVELSSEAYGITALYGPSGAGKTSILRAVAGLSKPDRAQITVDGTVYEDSARGICLPTHQRQIGYVFQEPRLFPHMSVAQNMEYGVPKRVSLPTRQGEIAEMLGISHLLDRRPKGLSGGEAQRVAIGRALMRRPKMLLMDEPLASLDQSRKEEILPYLDQLRGEAEVHILYVSHAMAEVARLADQIVVLDQGRVARSGEAGALLSDPDAVRDIGVREAGAIVDVLLSRADAGDGLSAVTAEGGLELLLPRVAAQEGAALRVRILASDVLLSRDRPDGLSALNVFSARILEMREGAGPGVAVALEAKGVRLMARVTRRSMRALKLAPGGQCYAILKTVSVAPMSVGRSVASADANG